jgi:hypothetical protein
MANYKYHLVIYQHIKYKGRAAYQEIDRIGLSSDFVSFTEPYIGFWSDFDTIDLMEKHIIERLYNPAVITMNGKLFDTDEIIEKLKKYYWNKVRIFFRKHELNSHIGFINDYDFQDDD